MGDSEEAAEEFLKPELALRASKRKLNQENWKSSIEAKKKREDRNKGCYISCNHSTSPDESCDISLIPIECVYGFHERYWDLKTAVKERSFIQKYISLHPQKRCRVDQRLRKARDNTIKCSIPTADGTYVKVCKKTFLSVLSIGCAKVELAGKCMFDDKRGMNETRDGKRPMLNDLRLQVIDHIKSFKVKERHYGRAGTIGRMYLTSELSVTAMYNLFLIKYPESSHCKYSFYYEVFRTCFNLGFGTVKTDTCSTCASFENQLQGLKYRRNETVETLASLKKEIFAQQVLHKLYKRFYKELNLKPEDTITINFDLMQNQALPKTSIGEAFYARQLWYYTFGIVLHTGTLNKDTLFFYRWLESEFGRGSNEILSCMKHFLNEIVKPKLYDDETKTRNNVTCLRLFCDSCTGQNKNYAAILMFMRFCYWNKVNFMWYFPVRGHSFMQADRSFSIAERTFKKTETILLPEFYDDKIKQVGNLFKLGSEVPVNDHQLVS